MDADIKAAVQRKTKIYAECPNGTRCCRNRNNACVFVFHNISCGPPCSTSPCDHWRHSDGRGGGAPPPVPSARGGGGGGAPPPASSTRGDGRPAWSPPEKKMQEELAATKARLAAAEAQLETLDIQDYR
jgi:hypothetical protein